MNDDRLIIGFCGPKGSGKDYGYQLLRDLYPTRDWKRVAFADPIKNTISKLFAMSVDDVNIVKRLDYVELIDRDQHRYGGISGRDLVRGIGMLMRDYDDNQFNRYVEKVIVDNATTNFAITDIRFDNEFDLIHRLGGVIIRINRPGYQYDHHITEQSIDKFDYVIDNTNRADYIKQLSNIIDRI